MTTEPFDPLYKKHFGKVEVVANGYVYPAIILYHDAVQGKYNLRIALPNGHAYAMMVEARRVRAPRSYAAAYDQPVVREEFLRDLAEKKAEPKKENIGSPKPKFQINAPARYVDTFGETHDAFIVGWTYERMSNPERFEYFYSVRIPNVSKEGVILGNYQVGNVNEGQLSEPVGVVEPKFKKGDLVEVTFKFNGEMVTKVGTILREDTIAGFKKTPRWHVRTEDNGQDWSYLESSIKLKTVVEEPKFKSGDRVAFTKSSANYGLLATVIKEDPKMPKYWELKVDGDVYKELTTHQDFIELYVVPKKPLKFKKGDLVVITDPNSPFEGERAIVSHIAHSVLQTEKADPQWIVRILGGNKDRLYSQSKLELFVEEKDPYQAILDEAQEKLAPFLEAVGEMKGNVDFKRIGSGIGQIVEYFGAMANFDPTDKKKKDKK